jgi:hypothetical protein
MQQSTDGDGEQNLKLEEDNHVVSNESQLHAKAQVEPLMERQRMMTKMGEEQGKM